MALHLEGIPKDMLLQTLGSAEALVFHPKNVSLDVDQFLGHMAHTQVAGGVNNLGGAVAVNTDAKSSSLVGGKKSEGVALNA